MNDGRWYSIQAKDEDEAEVLIYDDIGKSFFGEGVSAEEFVADLKEIEASTLNVRINSVGGQVFEGLAIHNALARHPARVVTHVDGIAASIASIVALAGEEVRMAENAFMMVHNPHGIVMGNAEDMREMAGTLDKIAGSMRGIYGRRTGKDEPTIRGWMDEETWFNAEEAIEAGLVDEATEEKDIEARGDLSHYRNVPDEVQEFVARNPEPGLAAKKEEDFQPEPDIEPEPEEADPEIVRLAAASMQTLQETRM